MNNNTSISQQNRIKNQYKYTSSRKVAPKPNKHTSANFQYTDTKLQKDNQYTKKLRYYQHKHRAFTNNLINNKTTQTDKLSQISKIDKKNIGTNATISTHIQLNKQSQKYIDSIYNIEQLFIFHQYFVADCDCLYFNESKKYMYNILQQVCKTNQHNKGNKNNSQNKINRNMKDKTNSNSIITTYKIFKYIQKYLPKPKLFDANFITQQRKQLQQSRQQIRLKTNTKQNKYSIFQSNLQSHKQQCCLSVGEKVFVFCIICQHFHIGSILSHYKDSYLINFTQPILGALKIKQYYVSSINKPYKINANKYPDHIYFHPQLTNKSLRQQKQQLSQDIQAGQKQIQILIDMPAFQVYLYLLQYKAQLINILNKYHNLAQINKNKTLDNIKKKNELTNQERLLRKDQIQEYGWVGCMVNIVSIAITYIETNFKVKIDRAVHKQKMGEKQKDKIKNEKIRKLNKMTILDLNQIYTRSSIQESEQENEVKIQENQINVKIQSKNTKNSKNKNKFEKDIKHQYNDENPKQYVTFQNKNEKNENFKTQIKKEKDDVNLQKDRSKQTAQMSINILQNLLQKGKYYKPKQDKDFISLQQRYKQKNLYQIQQITQKIHKIVQKLNKL